MIAVAIFEEQAHEGDNQIIVGGGGYGGYQPPYDYEDDLDTTVSRSTKHSGRGDKDVAKVDRAPAKKPAAPRPAETTRTAPPPADAPTTTGGAPGRARYEADYGGDEAEEEIVQPTVTQRNNRPGLGTEFGENRYSAASFTRFVRANNRPIAIAELRYNDFAGLVALGIHAQPLPDEGEIMTRETADPFPGDDRYAKPPR